MSEEQIRVLRVRCNECSQTFTVVTDGKKKFKEGEELGITCAQLKNVYPKAGGCDSKLVFEREQGKREHRPEDIMLTDLQEAAKESEPESTE